VLFQGLAGHLPYESDSPLQLLNAHVRAAIPELPDDVGPGLQAVVRRALAKSKLNRFPSALSMADALRGAATEPALVREGEAAAPEERPGETVVEAEAHAATLDAPSDAEDTQVRRVECASPHPARYFVPDWRVAPFPAASVDGSMADGGGSGAMCGSPGERAGARASGVGGLQEGLGRRLAEAQS